MPTLAEALAALRGPTAGARLLLDLTGARPGGAALAAVARGGRGRPGLLLRRSWRRCGRCARRTPAAEIALTWKTSARPAPALLAELAPRWLNLRFGAGRPADRGVGARARLLVVGVDRGLGALHGRLLALGVDADHHQPPGRPCSGAIDQRPAETGAHAAGAPDGGAGAGVPAPAPPCPSRARRQHRVRAQASSDVMTCLMRV